MRELYVCAGLFAEGPTDYRFLLPLIDRLLDDLLAQHYTARYLLASSHGIDAPRAERGQPREARIAAAVEVFWDRCTLFIIHADGAGDANTHRARCVAPGIATTRSRRPSCPIAACVPIRETEAWMLADPAPFERRLGAAPRGLPRDPERVADPKQQLQTIFSDANSAFSPAIDYSSFGEQVSLAALRRLTAFRALEAELLAALHALAVNEGVAVGAP